MHDTICRQIASWQVTSLDELIEALEAALAEAKSLGHLPHTVLIEAGVRLEEQTLTDGSKVIDLRIAQEPE